METEYILISRPDHENMAIKLNFNMYKNYLLHYPNNNMSKKALSYYLSYGYRKNVEPNYKKSLIESFFICQIE